MSSPDWADRLGRAHPHRRGGSTGEKSGLSFSAVSAFGHPWRETPELGTAVGIRVVMGMCNVLGRRLTRAFVSLLTVYYAVAGRKARRSSQDYLRRMGLPHGFWASYAHMRCFAHTVLDRVFFLQDRFEAFEIHYHGHEHLVRLLEEGKGAILLGAHIGSFEVMRAQSVARDIPIHIVGDFSNARRINAVLQRINPNLNARVLQVTPGSAKFALEVGEAIERGELVAILGDRAGHGKSIEVDFLGARASFPVGPYLLAKALRCPLYFTTSLHSRPDRYDLYCEPFAEELELPRGGRQEALRRYVQRYADRLEHYCRLAPNNWFNFFSFWSDPDGRTEPRSARPATASSSESPGSPPP